MLDYVLQESKFKVNFMKQIMITWYGITDFKSSISFEKSGPIIGALKTDHYDKIVILAYTSLEKKDSPELNNEDLFKDELKGVLLDSFESRNNFVNRWCNTNCAHKNFELWLKDELSASNISTEIIICNVESLRHLNDSENIYIAENKVIQNAVKTDPDASFTFYLSPGTPVMAFNWALSSMRFPRIDKRLLVSPQSDKAPEVVPLPQEWTEWESKNVSDNSELDVMFHLFGEQRVPVYLGMKAFKSKHHVFVNSSNYAPDVMEDFADKGSKCCTLVVDPFDPKNVVDKLEEAVASLPNNYRIGFNLTGGTKIMFAGALYVCRKVNGIAIYFDNHGHMINLNDFSTKDAPAINDVITFVKLNMNHLTVNRSGKSYVQIPYVNKDLQNQLISDCWEERRTLGGIYSKLNTYQKKDNTFMSFTITKGNLFVDFNQDDNRAVLHINGHDYDFKQFNNFGRFLLGTWFEMHIFNIMKKLEEKGIVHDVRTSYEVSFVTEDQYEYTQNPYQEFDVICTTGRRLIVIECKAGNVKSEHISKLSDVTRQFGGIESKGILVSCFKPSDMTVKEKIKDSKNIINICDENISEESFENAIKNFNRK